MCGVHPRVLASAIKRGLFPNADPQDRQLARAARHSRALLRGELFQVVKDQALQGDAKLAVWLLEKMTEPGELQWEETLPGPQDRPLVRQAIFAKPSADLLADIHAAGMKLVALTPEERQLPAPAVDGEFEEPEDEG